MALWMNRAGSRGEWEQKFLQDHRIYLQWEELPQNLSLIADRDELRNLLRRTYPDSPQGRIASYLGQIWIFTQTMKPGDWVGLPSKIKRVIHFGEITGPYEYDEKLEPALRHYRSVNWFALDIPRSNFSQDILYSFGPPTICGIKAEERIRAMAKNGWKPEGQAMIIELNEHLEALDRWIEKTAKIPAIAPGLSADERKQLQAVNRTIEQLTQVGVPIPEDLRNLKLRLSSKDASVAENREIEERISDVEALNEHLRKLSQAGLLLQKRLKATRRGGVEVPKLEDHLAYFTDPSVRSEVSKLLDEVKQWKPGRISMDPIKYAISMKVEGKVFAYLTPRHKHYRLATYNAENKWTKYAIHGDDDLQNVLPLMKNAMEKRMR